MATEKFNEIGKGGIVKEGIFVRFPELIPAEGSNYWRGDGKRKRLLLIGESNYFTRDWAEKSVFMDAERWYKEDTDKLIIEGLFTTITNVNFNDKTISVLIDRVQAEKERLVPRCLSCASACGRNDDYDMKALWGGDEDIRSLKSLIRLFHFIK